MAKSKRTKRSSKGPCEPSSITTQGSNGDEDRYLGDDGKPNRIGNFHKGLPHNDFGEVVRAAYDSLLKAVRRPHRPADFPAIQLGKGRKLVDPQAGLATDLEGPDPKRLEMLSAPRLDSAEEAAEAVELYWMALLRDVAFTRFDTTRKVSAAADDLSRLTDFTGPTIKGRVTPETIFRGCTPGELTGPYLSQFLLRDIPYGSLLVSQQQRTVVSGLDYLKQYDEWLCVQDGGLSSQDEFDGARRYIRNMRDLGQYVHVDALYEAYLNACLILLGMGAPFGDGNPYKEPNPNSKNQIGFGTFGGPHILSLVTEVATRALKAVWYQKWFVHRRLRPEAYGGLVQLKLEGLKGQKRDYPIHRQVLDSAALQESFSKNGNYLMPMAFSEGSPTHPAYGAGHGTVAGACVTILKAWFDESHPLANPVVPTSDGLKLVPYKGPGAKDLTVGGELNKVAANIAIGRNMAGVHWRSDYLESLRLGERVAICILFNQRKDYHEDYSFTFTGFDGDLFTITPKRVTKNGQKLSTVCKD